MFLNDCSRNVFIQKCFSSRCTISSTHEAYVLAVGNTPSGKRHTSRTKSAKRIGHMVGEIYVRRNIFGTTARSLRRILNPKNASQMKSTSNTPSSIGEVRCKMYKVSRHRCCLALNFGTIMPTTRIPTGTGL